MAKKKFPTRNRTSNNETTNAIASSANQTGSKLTKSNYSKYDNIETYVIIPPDGGFGWLIVMSSFLCQFLTDGSMYTFGIFIKEITFALNCTEAQVTLSSSIQSSCYNISGPIVCALTNRFGFRCVCIIGLILTSMAYVMSSFVESVYLFIIAHGLIGGFGFGMVYMPSLIIVGFYFEKWRALATSIIVSGSAFGTVVFPPVFTILFEELTWRDKFRIIGALAIIFILCACTYRPIKPTRVMRQTVSSGDGGVSGAGAGVIRMDLQSIASTMTSPLAVKQIFSKNHNLAFPTTADVFAKTGTYSITSGYDPSPDSSEMVITPTSSKSERGGASEYSRLPLSDSERLENILEEMDSINKCQLCCLKFRHKYSCRCFRKSPGPPFRPMYRDDALFTGSVAATSLFSAKTHTDRKSLDYHMSVTRVMTQRDYAEEFIPCVCCPISVKRTLATMFDCTLICSPSFLILAFSSFMSTLGVFIPYLYMVDVAIHKGNTKPETAVMLMTALGVSSALGRLACGLLSFAPRLRPLEFSAVALSVAGLSTSFFTVTYDIYWQFSYVVIYGLGLAITSATRPLVIVELVGLEKLSNAFGLQTLFQGIACLVGIPIASALLEVTGSYTIPFNFAGGTILIAGILLGIIRPVNNREKSRNR